MRIVATVAVLLLTLCGCAKSEQQQAYEDCRDTASLVVEGMLNASKSGQKPMTTEEFADFTVEQYQACDELLGK